MNYIPITIQRIDAETEEWVDLMYLHALQVNKTGSGENFNAGAEQYHPRLTFRLRWCRALEDVAHNTQTHRIIYRAHAYNIVDYDDYMEQHQTVNLVGMAYG